MTKNQLQAELKAKVKPGIKPSQLKRSKSAGDIPKAPSLPKTELARSKSAQELEPTNAKLEELEAKISTLELKLEVSQRELVEKDLEKQALQKQLETKSSNAELDQALIARHKNLKDWFAQYQKTKNLDQELSENINQASTELITQDQTISSLHTENNKLKQTNSQLSQDLKLAQRLAELRKEPLSSGENWPTFPSWGLVYLVLTTLALWFLMKPNHD